MTTKPSKAGGKRILLIDDEPDHIATLGLLLQQDGHAVECATNPLYAISVAKEFHPEFVFVDLGLPYHDGYATFEKIKRHCQGARFFALTARASEGAQRKSFDAGFEQHLVKPVDYAVIRTILES